MASTRPAIVVAAAIIAGVVGYYLGTVRANVEGRVEETWDLASRRAELVYVAGVCDTAEVATEELVEAPELRRAITWNVVEAVVVTEFPERARRILAAYSNVRDEFADGDIFCSEALRPSQLPYGTAPPGPATFDEAS